MSSYLLARLHAIANRWYDAANSPRENDLCRQFGGYPEPSGYDHHENTTKRTQAIEHRQPIRRSADRRRYYNGRRRPRKGKFAQSAIKSLWDGAPAQTEAIGEVLDPKDLELNLPFCHWLPSREPSPLGGVTFQKSHSHPFEVDLPKSGDGKSGPSVMTTPFALPMTFPRDDSGKLERPSCLSLLFGVLNQEGTSRCHLRVAVEAEAVLSDGSLGSLSCA